MFRRITLSALLAVAAIGVTFERSYADDPKPEAPKVAHRTVKIDGLDIFYREAGPKDAPPGHFRKPRIETIHRWRLRGWRGFRGGGIHSLGPPAPSAEGLCHVVVIATTGTGPGLRQV